MLAEPFDDVVAVRAVGGYLLELAYPHGQVRLLDAEPLVSCHPFGPYSVEMVDVLSFRLPPRGARRQGMVAWLAAGPLDHYHFEGAGGIS